MRVMQYTNFLWKTFIVRRIRLLKNLWNFRGSLGDGSCTWWWWAQQLKLSHTHIWQVFVGPVLEWIRWLCFSHVLWQRVPTVTDSDTEEHFPDGFGTSWNVNFSRMSSEVVYFRSPLMGNNWLSTRKSSRWILTKFGMLVRTADRSDQF